MLVERNPRSLINMKIYNKIGWKNMDLEKRRAYQRIVQKRHYDTKHPAKRVQRPLKDGDAHECKRCHQMKTVSDETFFRVKGGYFNRVCKVCQIKHTSKEAACRKYGITPEQYDTLRQRPCVLCGAHKRNAFDHCHASGKLRNVLCINCNHGLGNFKDNPDLLRLAAQYVEHYAAVHNGTL